MSEPEKKLTKKQLKALEFKKKKDGLEESTIKKEKKDNVDEVYAPISATELKKADGSTDKAEKKKRKREAEETESSGDKDKSSSKSSKSKDKKDDSESKKIKKAKKAKKSKKTKTESGEGEEATEASKPANRYIVFIGNLPYDCNADELTQHIKASAPAAVRLRKGFAFVEFNGSDATTKLNVALRLHHTVFKNRKINVELTAGGGGNTAARRQKIQEKNEKLREEHAQRIAQEAKAAAAKKKVSGEADAPSGPAPSIHPSRLRLME
ncbi:Nop6p [Sugiyamaella lignohabitans]|uniref:Nop6p n=1 Tax=Sugiyamaella lignohabitans TaxID=796027 RepID=A0A167F9V2_9ASCO|nr:Nop6p [Sugiyamaella lignohabitans]ANB15011.1 Nop6p [Sugiyamaella lignohabitans]